MASKATVFPQSIGVACTFDNELVKEMAKVIRLQMKAVGAHQALAPLIDVARMRVGEELKKHLVKTHILLRTWL